MIQINSQKKVEIEGVLFDSYDCYCDSHLCRGVRTPYDKSKPVYFACGCGIIFKTMKRVQLQQDEQKLP